MWSIALEKEPLLLQQAHKYPAMKSRSCPTGIDAELGQPRASAHRLLQPSTCDPRFEPRHLACSRVCPRDGNARGDAAPTVGAQQSCPCAYVVD